MLRFFATQPVSVNGHKFAAGDLLVYPNGDAVAEKNLTPMLRMGQAEGREEVPAESKPAAEDVPAAEPKPTKRGK